MKYKHLKDLDGLYNELFLLHWSKEERVLQLINKKNCKYVTCFMPEEKNVSEELELYGFDCNQLEKAELGIIEAIAQEENVTVSLVRGQWLYTKHGQLHNLNDLLRRSGYYV